MNHLSLPLEGISTLQHVDRNKRDVLENVTGSAQRNGKFGAKSAQQKPSNTSQRTVQVHPVQPGKSTKLPTSAENRGRLPLPSSDHLNPERKHKSTQDVAITSALWMGSDHSPLGATGPLSEGLQENHKENLCPQASRPPELTRTFQSDGNSPGKKRVLAYGQSSATSRPIVRPKDRINNCQAKGEPVPDKSRKVLPGSESLSQKTRVRSQALQPPQFPPASADVLHKNPGTKQGKPTTVRQPLEKPSGTAPVGGRKQQCQPPPVRNAPIKPPASGRPQRTTNLKSNLNPGGTVPTVKEGTDRKEMKVVPPRHTVTSRGTGHPNQPCSTHYSKAHASEGDLRSRRDQLKPELQKASGMQAMRVPRIPSAADRKRQLEEWLASKGKKYKRPPMMLLQKQAVNPPCRKVKAKEKQENPEQCRLAKINSLLTECLKLVEEGVPAEEVSAVLSLVPQAEKFAKFWICQVKLLAQSGPFDVTGLYRAAVCAGAEPLQELREVVLDIVKAAGHTSEGNLNMGVPAGVWLEQGSLPPPAGQQHDLQPVPVPCVPLHFDGGKKAEQHVPCEPTTPCPGEGQPIASTPGPAGGPLASLPPSIKLQVTSLSRGKLFLRGPELKFLTPVRRSERIELVGSRYPEMLKDHDPVVSSLSEILDAEGETQFFFRKNKFLPEVTELEGVSSHPSDCC